MATEGIVIRRFCMGDDRLDPVKKRPDANWYDSEIVTIVLLFALRSGQYRPFSRWLAANKMGTCFRRGARPDASATPVALVERVDGRISGCAIVLSRGGMPMASNYAIRSAQGAVRGASAKKGSRTVAGLSA